MLVHDLIYTFVSAFIALFPVVNPISDGLMVDGFINGLNKEEQQSVIKKITINCILIGLISLLAGHLILMLFNLAIPVIQLAGGILICKTGLEGLSDSKESNSENDKERAVSKMSLDTIQKKIFYPLSFPICFGPGSISVIFTLMAGASVRKSLLETSINYAIIALAVLVLCLMIYVFCSQGQKIMRKLGPSGSLIINKLVSFLTFCIGIQIIVTGISKIFHIPIL